VHVLGPVQEALVKEVAMPLELVGALTVKGEPKWPPDSATARASGCCLGRHHGRWPGRRTRRTRWPRAESASKADLGGFPGPTGLDGAQAWSLPRRLRNRQRLRTAGAGAANAHQSACVQNSPLAGRVTRRGQPNKARLGDHQGDWPLASL